MDFRERPHKWHFSGGSYHQLQDLGDLEVPYFWNPPYVTIFLNIVSFPVPDAALEALLAASLTKEAPARPAALLEILAEILSGNLNIS